MIIIGTNYEHIHDCVDALMNCDDLYEVYALLGDFPCKFGDWWVDVDEDADGNAFYVVKNQWWDKQAEEYCIDAYELDIEVEDEDKEELEIDAMYHDADERELRKMGCFGDDDEEDYFDNDFDPDGRRSEKPWDYSKHYDEEDCFDCFDDEEDEE